MCVGIRFIKSGMYGVMSIFDAKANTYGDRNKSGREDACKYLLNERERQNFTEKKYRKGTTKQQQ